MILGDSVRGELALADLPASAPPAGRTGTASITEAGDTVVATDTLKIQGVVAVTEADDTVVATDTLAIKGVVAVTEDDDTVVATATTGSTPVPPPVIIDVGDGYIRQGSLIRWFRRPDQLQPDKAEDLAIKKVAKRSGVSKHIAVQAVRLAERELATTVNYLRASSLAMSGKRGDEYTRDELTDMREFWAEVVRRAVEIEDDDDMILLT